MHDPHAESKPQPAKIEQPVEYLPPQPPPAKKSLLRKLGPVGLLLFYLFGKLKYVGLILQIGKFKTFFTMLISIWAYAMFWGWPFAVGFVALLFIHEMGHVVALRMMGIKATAPMFIPFMGAYIGMKQMPDNAFAEAVMAYGGPLLGTLGAIGCAGAGFVTGNPFWFALAGGRIIGVISPKLWILGLLGAVALFYYTWSPIIALVIIMGSFQIYSASKKPAAEKARYYAVTPGKRIAMGAAFLGLLAITSFGMVAMQIPLDHFQHQGMILQEQSEDQQSQIRIRTF